MDIPLSLPTRKILRPGSATFAMSTEKKQPPKVPAAGAFYNLFASKPADPPPVGEPRSKVSLRQKAEAHFRERENLSQEKLDSLSPESLRTILHELRVHQIELEMQNEELRRAQADLDVSRAHYFDLYDLAPVGYVTVSEAGLILEVNLTAATLLGLDRPALVKQPISRFILKEDQDIFYLLNNKPLATVCPTCDLRMVQPDGTTFWANLKKVSAHDDQGESQCRIVLSDISWRKLAEEDVRSLNAELRASEERLHELNALGELLLLPNSIEKKFKDITDSVVRVFGADFARIWIIKSGDRCNTGCVHAQVAEGPHMCRFRDKCLHLLASSGRYTHTDGGAHARVPFGCYKIGKIATGEEAGFLTNEVPADPRVHDHAWANELGLTAFAGYCLVDADGTPVGVMAFFSKQAISKNQDLLMRGFAHLAALTLIASRSEASLAKALLQANTASNAKSEFLGIMSHELRNPLNGVLGFAEILSDTSLDDEQKDYVRMISSSGEHLLSVVNDTLDFSSIEAGTLAIHPAPFDLAHLVKLSSDLVRKSAADKGLAFQCDVAADVPEQITGDGRRIRQILINLLANAVKFTSDGSVSLRVTRSGPPEPLRPGRRSDGPRRESDTGFPACEPTQTQAGKPVSHCSASRYRNDRGEPTTSGGASLDFSVEDTGLGISSEALTRLFQLFTQADSTINQKYGGTGIGLAVSQRLAEAMGGSISVVSAPGKGSTFTFRLPLEVPAGGMASVPSHLLLGADGASPSSASAETPHNRLPVLVVEDDRNSRTLAGKLLQSLGYRAEFAGNGAEAADAFAPGKYLAILMDLRMPVMNGFDAVATIRSRESGSRVPIIALSANVTSGSREIYLAAGMDDFLSKPFKKEELAAKLACVAQIEGAAEGAPA